jgi:hypothetical protein
VRDWQETDDPYALVASLLPGARRVALDDHMWAEKVLHLRTALPAPSSRSPVQVLRELRMRKAPTRSRRCAGPRGDRPRARPDGGVAAAGPHRA